jgi:hypothetical protein
VKGYRLGIVGAAALGLLIMLFVPDSGPELPPIADSHPFRWDRAELFGKLEGDFQASRSSTLEATRAIFDGLEQEGLRVLEEIELSGSAVPEEALARLESIQFELAVHAAAHAPLLPRTHGFIQKARLTVMRSALGWPLDRAEVHAAVYRVIYGGRSAIEEALAQTGSDLLPALVHLEDIPSSTPWTEVAGVRVHSGDILLSRGGAPTSALIARGNDFPGVFSHAALVHVAPETGEATVIEALIERGAVLSTAEEYLEAKKLRILLLRPRPELGVIEQDPLAPHQAATAMLAWVRDGEVRYDFPMDWKDPEKFFCSEVPYHAYGAVGIDLWAVQSNMSEPGLVRWLASLGVRHFTSLVPSDLEYDPRLGAVAEWRDVSTLRQHRFDNVILDVLLEGADRGDRLGYPWYHLPVARLLKGWSVAEGLLGGVPTIPGGMSASTALRVDALSHRIHPALRASIEGKAAAFLDEKGYEAPYWALFEMAREALEENRASLAPALRGP